MTPAHQTESLAELVCSNTFNRSNPSTRTACSKREMRLLRGGQHRVAGGGRGADPRWQCARVDRVAFAAGVETRVLAHPNITLVRGEVSELPSPGIVATGPLTSDALAGAIASRLGVQSARVLRCDRAHRLRRFRSTTAGSQGLALRQGRGRRLLERAAHSNSTRRSLRR